MENLRENYKIAKHHIEIINNSQHPDWLSDEEQEIIKQSKFILSRERKESTEIIRSVDMIEPPKILIGEVASFLNEIPNKIKHIAAVISSEQSAITQKTKSLKKEGFSDDEINKIIGDDHVERLSNKKAEINNLTSMAKKCERFLGDAPFYDESTLDGVHFESFINGREFIYPQGEA